MRKVALDLGDRKIAFSEAVEGKIAKRLTVTSLETLAHELGDGRPAATVAIEACREAWHVHDVLESWGNTVLVVDTTRVRQIGIGQHGRKTDRLDADVLALALERGGIPLAHVLSPSRRELRRWLSVRRGLVESRASMVVMVRGLCREVGQPLPSCLTRTFVKRARETRLSDRAQAMVEPLLCSLETITNQLTQVEAQLASECAKEPIIRLLTTAPGVATIVAAAFVSVVDDAGRFASAHQLESYLGLVPSEDSSGGRRRIGSITKQGNSYLRALLIESAWVILRNAPPDDPLRRWALALQARRGQRVGVVALARRLAGVLWAMWKKNTFYDPQRLAERVGSTASAAPQSPARRADALRTAAKKQRALRYQDKEVVA